MSYRMRLLAVVVVVPFVMGVPAKADFEVKADVVNRYVWRGLNAGDNVSLQPSLSYEFSIPGKISGEVGTWSSWSISNSGNSGPSENDLYIQASKGDLTIKFTDYYFPDDDINGVIDPDFFAYSSDSKVHQLEIKGEYTPGSFGLA